LRRNEQAIHEGNDQRIESQHLSRVQPHSHKKNRHKMDNKKHIIHACSGINSTSNPNNCHKRKKPPKESELIPETRTTFLSNRRYNGNPNKSPRPDIISPATTRIEIYDKGSRSRTTGPISLFSNLMEKE
jgi:hypothetical protein